MHLHPTIDYCDCDASELSWPTFTVGGWGGGACLAAVSNFQSRRRQRAHAVDKLQRAHCFCGFAKCERLTAAQIKRPWYLFSPLSLSLLFAARRGKKAFTDLLRNKMRYWYQLFASNDRLSEDVNGTNELSTSTIFLRACYQSVAHERGWHTTLCLYINKKEGSENFKRFNIFPRLCKSSWWSMHILSQSSTLLLSQTNAGNLKFEILWFHK
jgi:hypothetical protein